MITKEQVADLRPGDVVEYAGHPDLHGAKIVGPVRDSDGSLFLADYVVRHNGGQPPNYVRERLTLTVVSRAPRPLYVNHSRIEPLPGDVVNDADDPTDEVWFYAPLTKVENRGPSTRPWITTRPWPGVGIARSRSDLPDRLRLLVDGETGQVVP